LKKKTSVGFKERKHQKLGGPKVYQLRGKDAEFPERGQKKGKKDKATVKAARIQRVSKETGKENASRKPIRRWCVLLKVTKFLYLEEGQHTGNREL